MSELIYSKVSSAKLKLKPTADTVSGELQSEETQLKGGTEREHSGELSFTQNVQFCELLWKTPTKWTEKSTRPAT